MKKNSLAVLCVVCCLGMAACGKTEEQNSDKVVAVNAEANTAETEVVATSETKIEETTEVETEAETNTDDIEYEEVIGDVDVDTSSISVIDMSKMVLNLDIMVFEDGTSFDAVGLNNFEILFPGGMYITEDWGEYGVETAMDNFTLSIVAETFDNTISPDEEDVVLLEKDDYTLYLDGHTHKDSDISLYNRYIVVNKNTGVSFDILLTIIKNNVEASDKFIAEYIPAFEETLISNF